MKKNVKTYLLLVLVIVIWAAVAYTIIDGLSPVQDENVPNTDLQTKFNVEPSKKRDTFSIVANYRDPFLGTLPIIKKKKSSGRPVKIIKPLPSIKYTGTIGSGKSKVYFVSINGQQHLMSLGEKANDVKLIYGSSDKIKIKFNGMISPILLQQ